MRHKTDLRKQARGQKCMVRLPGICSWDPDQTVLAHYRRANVAGMGQKPADLIAVWACHGCHNEIDRRTTVYTRSDLDAAMLDALCRQLDWYVKNDIVSW